VACPECGVELNAAEFKRTGQCGKCKWPDGPSTAIAKAPKSTARAAKTGITTEPEEEVIDAVAERPEKKKKAKKRRPRARSDDGVGFSMSGYSVGILILVSLWGGLAWLATAKKGGAYLLIFVGVMIAFVGLAWLRYRALRDGVENISFLSFSTPNLFVRMFTFGCEALIMPIFSLVYLFMFFETAWKPFLVEAVGVGMVVTGVLMLR
jgi:hypothetical protein